MTLDDPADDAPDQTLVVAARSGDRGALELLLARHLDRVYAICRRVLTDPDDAADATQEALIVLTKRLDRYDDQARFTTWMYRVVTNVAIDEYRRRRRRPDPFDDVPEDPRRSVPGEDLGDGVADRIDVDSALAQLPVEFRAAVALRDLADLDYATISEVLEIPPGTVRSRIARGRTALAATLGNQSADADRLNGEPR